MKGIINPILKNKYGKKNDDSNNYQEVMVSIELYKKFGILSSAPNKKIVYLCLVTNLGKGKRDLP